MQSEGRSNRQIVSIRASFVTPHGDMRRHFIIWFVFDVQPIHSVTNVLDLHQLSRIIDNVEAETQTLVLVCVVSP